MSPVLRDSIELGQAREFHIQGKIRESEAVTTANNAPWLMKAGTAEILCLKM